MSDRYFGYQSPTGIDHPVATYPPDPATLDAASEATQRTTFAMESEGDATLPDPHIVEYWEMVRYDDHEKVYALAQAWKRMSDLFGITGDNLYEKASWLAERWSSPQARDEFLRRVGGAIKSYDDWRDLAYTNYTRLEAFAAQLEKTRGTVHEQYLYFAGEYNKVFNPPAGVVDPGPGVRDPLVKATTAAWPDMEELADTAAGTQVLYEEQKYQGPLDAKQPNRSFGGSPTAPPRPAPPPPPPAPPPTTQVSHPGTPPVTQPVGQPPVTPGTDPGPVLSGRAGMPAAPPAPTPAPAAPPTGAPAAPPGTAPGVLPSTVGGAPGPGGVPPAPGANSGRSGAPPAPPPSRRSAPPSGAARPGGARAAGASPPVPGSNARGTMRPPASLSVSPPRERGAASSPRAAGTGRPGQVPGVPPAAGRGTPPVIPGGRGQRTTPPSPQPRPAITHPEAPAAGPGIATPRGAGIPPRLTGRAAGEQRPAPPRGSGTPESNLLGRTGKTVDPAPGQRPPTARPAPSTTARDGEELWHLDAPPGPAVIDAPAAPQRPEGEGQTRRRA